jgi:hypothetical protein
MKSPWMSRLTLAIIAFGALRALSLILANPVHGYADQGDAVRTGACVGVKPALAPFETTTNPIASAYLRSVTEPSLCMFSATVPVLQAALAIDRAFRASDDHTFDIRVLGALYFLALLAIALTIDRATAAQPRLRLAHAIVFALVLCDPAVTLYFNTLLTEPIALVGFYASLAILWFASQRVTTALLIAFAVAAFILAFSRTQHFALPLLFAIGISLISKHEPSRLKFAALLVALVAGGLALIQSGHTGTIQLANRSNAVLHALAPASNEPARFVARLGLDDDNCAKLVGASWYLQYGHRIASDCPALGKVTNLRLGYALMAEPMILPRVAYKSLLFSGNVRLNFLSEINNIPVATSARSTLGGFGVSLFDALPERGFFARLAFASFVLIVATASLLRRDRTALDFLSAFLAAVAVLVWALSLIGDGFSELTRHAHIAVLCACATVVFAIIRCGAVKDLVRVGLCVASSIGFAWIMHSNFAVSHATPNAQDSRNGMLVLSSHEVNRVVATIERDASREHMLIPADPFTRRVLGVPASLLGWMPSPVPRESETQAASTSCFNLKLDFIHTNGLRSSRKQCVKTI